MKRIVMDLDGTLTLDAPGISYQDKAPNLAVIAKLRSYKEAGFTIVIATSRNMRTYQGSVGLITANTLPIIFDWLQRHDVPYDEIQVAKPWCGTDGFYVDDKAIRPDEFTRLSYAEIRALTTPPPDADDAA